MMDPLGALKFLSSSKPVRYGLKMTLRLKKQWRDPSTPSKPCWPGKMRDNKQTNKDEVGVSVIVCQYIRGRVGVAYVGMLVCVVCMRGWLIREPITATASSQVPCMGTVLGTLDDDGALPPLEVVDVCV